MGKQISQEEFREKLSELTKAALAKNRYISERVVREAFSDYDFSDEQLSMVYDFLRSKRITVGGAVSDLEAKKPREEKQVIRKTWSQEEDDYLRRYRGELLAMKNPKEGTPEFEAVLEDAAGGASEAKNRLLEFMLTEIMNLACDLYEPGVMLQDLISEGNLEGMLALERMDLTDRKVREAFRNTFLSEVRDGLLAFLGEARETKITDQRMVDRVHEFSDYAEVLKEDLGRKVYLDEVAEIMDITEEEAEAILRLTGEREDDKPDEA